MIQGMKRSIEEHAQRFTDIAPEYDEDTNAAYRATVSLVLEYADPTSTDTVLDLGCGTGAVGLGLADTAARVVGRDISSGMLEQARTKATDRGLANVSFEQGSFREPNYDGPADIIVSNYALHHLSDAEKRDAIEMISAFDPRRFVLGDVMFFGPPNPDEPSYDPAVDDPATVGTLVEALTDTGFVVTAATRVTDQVGVLVAERSER